MKIAIIGSRGYPYVYSGYETFVAELSQRLVKKGHEVYVYCHRGLFIEKKKNVNGIQLIYIPTIQNKILSQFTNSFLSTLHAVLQPYDIILYVNAANGPFGLITKAFCKKTIINVDGLEWLRPKWKGLGSKYFYFASKLASKYFNKVVCDSTVMADIYKKEFDVESSVIAYGANIRYSQNPDIIKKWNLTINDYYLVVGRLIPDNNADIIIKEFLRSNSHKKLVVVGDVPYKDAYADTLKSINDERIIFTGYITDQDLLAELYHNCYAYIHGHEYGGTNPTMLNAMAYGCAIIALDTPFTREMCDNDKHALYFTKKEGSLKTIIDMIEKNEEILKRYREISRERIKNFYTWEKITNQYEHLFLELRK